MNDTHQVLAYADDVYLIRDDIRTLEKVIGLAVNTGKTKYMEIGRHWGMIANAHVKIGSNSYEKVKTFKYFGSLLTNQNSIQEEIKCRLKAGNACYDSDLTERNANHIIPSYCCLPVSSRSLVNRCGSLGSCKPQI